jgi:hypothetical protein
MSLNALLSHIEAQQRAARPHDAAPKISASEIVRCWKLATNQIPPPPPDVNSTNPAERGAALILAAYDKALGKE